VSSLFFALGGILTSQASSLGVFLAGRAVQGLGGAGIMTISFILVLELVSKKRRGLYIGLANTGFTTGVSFGAVVAGALLNTMGWVSFLLLKTENLS
jgi:MFS family permease